MLADIKVVGIKTCHSPTTFGRYETTFLLFKLNKVIFIISTAVVRDCRKRFGATDNK